MSEFNAVQEHDTKRAASVDVYIGPFRFHNGRVRWSGPSRPAGWSPQQILFINQPLQYFSLTKPVSFSQVSDQRTGPIWREEKCIGYHGRLSPKGKVWEGLAIVICTCLIWLCWLDRVATSAGTKLNLCSGFASEVLPKLEHFGGKEATRYFQFVEKYFAWNQSP